MPRQTWEYGRRKGRKMVPLLEEPVTGKRLKENAITAVIKGKTGPDCVPAPGKLGLGVKIQPVIARTVVVKENPPAAAIVPHRGPVTPLVYLTYWKLLTGVVSRKLFVAAWPRRKRGRMR